MAKVKPMPKKPTKPKAKKPVKEVTGLLLSPYWFAGPGKIDPERMRAAIRKVMAEESEKPVDLFSDN